MSINTSSYNNQIEHQNKGESINKQSTIINLNRTKIKELIDHNLSSLAFLSGNKELSSQICRLPRDILCEIVSVALLLPKKEDRKSPIILIDDTYSGLYDDESNCPCVLF